MNQRRNKPARRIWIVIAWISVAGVLSGCGTLQWKGQATKQIAQTHSQSLQTPIVLSVEGPTLERYKEQIASRLHWILRRPVRLRAEGSAQPSVSTTSKPIWVEVQETADRYEDSLEPQWVMLNPFQFDPASPTRSITPYGDTSYYYLERLPGPRHLLRLTITVQPTVGQNPPSSQARSRTFWVEEPYLVETVVREIRRLLR